MRGPERPRHADKPCSRLLSASLVGPDSLRRQACVCSPDLAPVGPLFFTNLGATWLEIPLPGWTASCDDIPTETSRISPLFKPASLTPTSAGRGSSTVSVPLAASTLDGPRPSPVQSGQQLGDALVVP